MFQPSPCVQSGLPMLAAAGWRRSAWHTGWSSGGNVWRQVRDRAAACRRLCIVSGAIQQASESLLSCRRRLPCGREAATAARRSCSPPMLGGWSSCSGEGSSAWQAAAGSWMFSWATPCVKARKEVHTGCTLQLLEYTSTLPSSCVLPGMSAVSTYSVSDAQSVPACSLASICI